jgi:hypothetical protein
MKDDSVAEQMNRGMFLAPSLIDGDGEESPLLAQAKRNVEATAERAAAGVADEEKRPEIKKPHLFGVGRSERTEKTQP